MILEELYKTTTRKITNTEIRIVFQKISIRLELRQLSKYISELEEGLSVVQNRVVNFPKIKYFRKIKVKA